MAFGAKTALMFMLLAAMAMATHASGHYVACKNEYCKPITVNGVVIGAGLTLDVLVDDVLQTLTCAVPDIFGKVVIGTYNCPPQVTGVVILELNLGIVLEVITCTLPSLLNTILGNLTIDLAVCL